MNPSQERNGVRLAVTKGTIDPNYQKEMVARLVGECERLISRGLLPELEEMKMRERVNNTCAAFCWPSIAERSEEMKALDFNLALVAHEMEQPQ